MSCGGDNGDCQLVDVKTTGSKNRLVCGVLAFAIALAAETFSTMPSVRSSDVMIDVEGRGPIIARNSRKAEERGTGWR